MDVKKWKSIAVDIESYTIIRAMGENGLRNPGNMIKKMVSDSIKKIAKNIEAGKERDIKAYYILFNHFYKNVSYDEFKAELAKKDWTWISAKLALNYVAYYIDNVRLIDNF